MSEQGEVIACEHEGCTFAETQVCARTGGSEPCEFAVFDDADADDDEIDILAVEAVARDVDAAPHPPLDDLGFHVGQELGEEELDSLLNAERYGQIILVLGDALAGKTSLLITFYMLLAAGELEDEGLSFAGSLTLPGFETRCRHTRIWVKGAAPPSMTARTMVGGPRGAGFLHLDVVDGKAGAHRRLLLSDLPGEWTREFILHQRFGSRLSFAGRADKIVIVVDGEGLVGTSRWVVLEDQKLLVDRLSELLGDARPPLAVVATRRDVIGKEAPPVLSMIAEHAAQRGFPTQTFIACTFARDDQTPSGEGVMPVLRFCLGESETPTLCTADKPGAGRLFGWEPAMTGQGPI